MTKVNFFGMVAAIIFLSAFTINSSMTLQIEEGYSIEFSSEKASGVFSNLTGDIEFDQANLAASKFNVQIEVASINTGNGMQNKHAKSDKWFDAEQYPTINFTSDKFAKTANGYEVMGTLEMHGIKKEFTMPFTFKNDIFESSFTVNRLDYNIGSTKGMSKKVPLDIKLDISVPVTK